MGDYGCRVNYRQPALFSVAQGEIYFAQKLTCSRQIQSTGNPLKHNTAREMSVLALFRDLKTNPTTYRAHFTGKRCSKRPIKTLLKSKCSVVKLCTICYLRRRALFEKLHRFAAASEDPRSQLHDKVSRQIELPTKSVMQSDSGMRTPSPTFLLFELMQVPD